jgi:hypothetical protein
MNLAAPGACGATAKKCSAGMSCDGKAKCNLDQGTKQQCNILDPGGTCWQLPEACPDNGGGGGRTRSCLGLSGDECSSYCEAVDKEEAFYKSNSCP